MPTYVNNPYIPLFPFATRDPIAVREGQNRLHHLANAGEAPTVSRQHGHPEDQKKQKRPNTVSLTPWEEAAVKMYRGIRGFHQQQLTANATETSATKAAMLKSLLSTLSTAFPFAADAGRDVRGVHAYLQDKLSAKEAVPRARMLEYFMRVGYPMRVSTDSSASGVVDARGDGAIAYTALLVKAAEQTVRWFYHADTDRDTFAACLSALDSATVPRDEPSFTLLPDILQQMVAVHLMSPRTAARWVVRVCVGLLHSESNRRAEERHYCDGVPRGTLPKAPLPWDYLEVLCLCAKATAAAVWRLQDCALPPVHVDEPGGSVGDEASDGKGGGNAGPDGAVVAPFPLATMETSANWKEWKYIDLLVTQEAILLLLSGCRSTEIRDSERRAAAEKGSGSDSEKRAAPCHAAPPVQSNRVTVFPRFDSSFFILEGLAMLAFCVRNMDKYRIPGGERPAQHRSEVQWAAFAECVVRRLNDLSPSLREKLVCVLPMLSLALSD